MADNSSERNCLGPRERAELCGFFKIRVGAIPVVIFDRRDCTDGSDRWKSS